MQANYQSLDASTKVLRSPLCRSAKSSRRVWSCAFTSSPIICGSCWSRGKLLGIVRRRVRRPSNFLITVPRLSPCNERSNVRRFRKRSVTIREHQCGQSRKWRLGLLPSSPSLRESLPQIPNSSPEFCVRFASVSIVRRSVVWH